MFNVTKNDPLTFLMTGDIERLAENWLIDNSENLQANLLKIPHHGSATSSSQNFLSAAKPKYAVIWRGDWYDRKNKLSLKKITERLRKNGIKYYITLNSGAILYELGIENGKPVWNYIDWRNQSFLHWLFAYYR